jgi:hypothetical protein
MGIKIIEEPDIFLTKGELARYERAYERAYSHYAGTPPTLEEYIRICIRPAPSTKMSDCNFDFPDWALS